MRLRVGREVSVADLQTKLQALIEAGDVREALDLVGEKVLLLNTYLVKANLELLQLLRKQTGITSERLDVEQLDLSLQRQVTEEEIQKVINDDDEKAEEAEDAQPEKPKKRRGKNQKPHGRRPLPEHLRRERIEVWPSEEDCQCPDCHLPKEKIGERIHEILEFVPAQFYVLQYAMMTMACPRCEGQVSRGSTPDKVIEGGLPGPALLSHVLVSKYVDHCPLRRLQRICLRSGVELAESTLVGWVEQGHEILKPLACAIVRMCLAAHVLQGDDTGVKVLDPSAPGGSKRGHLWCYLGDGQYAAFQYTPDWKGEHPQKFLEDREGYFQADAYKGYDAIFKRQDRVVVEVACWAHARRHFVETLAAGDERAALPLRFIQNLYRVEREATEAKLSAEARQRLRQERSVPLLQGLGRWLQQTYAKEPPKSLFGKAMGYTLRQWTALNRYTEDGHLSIDNTAVERALRAVACGRKNYLFCGSDAGGERAATLYTIFGTCALVGAEPMAYLTDVLTKLSQGWPNSRIEELLPPQWLEAHPEHRVGQPAPMHPNQDEPTRR